MSGLEILDTSNAFYYLAKANASQDSLYDSEQKVSKEDAIKQAILQQLGSINDLFSKLALLNFLKKAYANAGDADLKGFINGLYNQSENIKNQIWQIFYGHYKDLENLDKQERRSKDPFLTMFGIGDTVPNGEKKDQDEINSATKTIESLLKSKNPDNLQALEAAVGKLSDGLQKEQTWVKKNDPFSKASDWIQKNMSKAKAGSTGFEKWYNKTFASMLSGPIFFVSDQFAQRNMWKSVSAAVTQLSAALTSKDAAVELLSNQCSEDSNTISLKMQQYQKNDTDYTNFLSDTLKTASDLISGAVIDNNS